MRTLIIYASKTGTTEKCARNLQSRIGNASVVNILEQKIDLSSFDLVIFGSPIRMGKINKKIKKFIDKNKVLLKTKKTAYFICCGFVDDYRKYFANNIPKELLESAIIYDNFGGELDSRNQKGIDKIIVKIMSKTEAGKKEIKISNENIDEFINRINQSY